MDDQNFDQWTRSLSSFSSRRTLSKLLAGGALGTLFAVFSRADGDAKQCVAPSKRCKRKHGKKRKCCGGATCKGTKCKCPAGRQACGKTCCANGEQCQAGTCRGCDVCASGCPFPSVQAAIAAARPGATVRLCPGTFPGSIVIDKDLTLAGSGTTATTLEGNGTTEVLRIAAGTTVVVRELTITGGQAGNGGGVINLGTATLDAVSVTGNTAAVLGGGILNSGGGTLTLRDSRVTGNSASSAGGGLYTLLGTLRLENSRVTGNTAVVGGGIGLGGGTLTVGAGSRVTANRATGGADTGGGIYNNGGAVTLAAGATVQNNTPEDCAGDPPVSGSCPTP